MKLSSNSIIHFTDNIDAIYGIFSSGFRLKYCKESISTPIDKLVFFAPMVSFCDIPMSQVKEHISKYGNYGIGLTKEWAERKGLNPVLYLERQSTVSKSMYLLLESILSEAGEPDVWEQNETYAADLVRFMKNYQDDLVRKNHPLIENYRFSDEREWRYCPPRENCTDMILAERYMELFSAEANEKLQPFNLEFEAKDIKYIVLEKESEIIPFIDFMRREKGEDYSYRDIEILSTRIVTSDQIKTDF
ncbi:abortive infection system antitoxin AbiGi family protein [Vibrio cholerae]|uniref:abortive infection system antitoxin AbiGi family protein n=1 Tax=Vibrio cholerae TaxID=666 RepID=UPI003966C24D